MADPPETIESLQARLDNLEMRVSTLEKAGGHNADLAPASTAPASHAAPAATTAGAAGVLSVFGRAMLGIAGAYLLRAIAASTAVPPRLVAALALLYALGWLIGAARTAAWLPRTVYAFTSALILAPMLWELTLRFQVLAPAATALALGAFVAVALAYSVSCNLIPLLWVATGTAAGLAIALLFATHSDFPFALLLAAILAALEFGASRSPERSVRVLAAVAADLAVWIQIDFYSSAPTAGHSAWRTAELLPALLILLISCGSALERSARRRQPLSGFDILQATAAFLLGVFALLLFAPATGASAVRFSCLLLAAAFYAVSCTLFANASQTRNRAVFSTWAAMLLLTGLAMSPNTQWFSATLGLAALAAMLAGVRLQRLVWQFHGAAYLTIAAAATGLPIFIARALNGPVPVAPHLLACFAAAVAVLGYAVTRSQPAESRALQALHLYLAGAATAVIAAFLIGGLAHILSRSSQLLPHHLAFVRTLVLCLLALGLAYAGSRRQRPELTRIAYAAIALVALKLLVEDLRSGHMEYIAGSICLFALTLISAPRLIRGAPVPGKHS